MKHIAKILIEFVKHAMADANWRERYVDHVTPTGQRNRVKIKSLPIEEQEKYRPIKSEYEGKVLAITKKHFDAIKNCAGDISNAFNSIISQSECCDNSIMPKYISDVSDTMNVDIDMFSRKLRQEFESLRNKESSKLRIIPRSSPEFQPQIDKIKDMDEAFLSFLDYKRHNTPHINLQREIHALPQGKKPVDRVLRNNEDKLSSIFKQWETTLGSSANANVYTRLLNLQN